MTKIIITAYSEEEALNLANQGYRISKTSTGIYDCEKIEMPEVISNIKPKKLTEAQELAALEIEIGTKYDRLISLRSKINNA
jgi:hypothetical protein